MIAPNDDRQQVRQGLLVRHSMLSNTEPAVL